MSSKTIKILTVILALCAGVASYSLYRLNAAEQPITPDSVLGNKRPDFTLYDLEQNLRHIENWDGKLVIINFWATWCPPCLKEIPDLNAFYAQYRDQDVALIGIAHDTPEKVREFMQTLPMEYDQLADPMLAVELSKLFGNQLGTLPYTVVIDKAGIVRYIHEKGVISQQELSEIVKPWL